MPTKRIIAFRDFRKGGRTTRVVVVAGMVLDRFGLGVRRNGTNYHAGLEIACFEVYVIDAQAQFVAGGAGRDKLVELYNSCEFTRETGEGDANSPVEDKAKLAFKAFDRGFAFGKKFPVAAFVGIMRKVKRDVGCSGTWGMKWKLELGHR
jgi:hypothetical protein